MKRCKALTLSYVNIATCKLQSDLMIFSESMLCISQTSRSDFTVIITLLIGIPSLKLCRWWSSIYPSVCLSSYSKMGEEAQSDVRMILFPLWIWGI